MKQGILLNSFTDAKILVPGQPVLPAEPGPTHVCRIAHSERNRSGGQPGVLLPCCSVAPRSRGTGSTRWRITT